MIRTALTLAARGLCVFPCRPREKLPATPRGCLDASKDPSMIRHWWGLNPHYNLAIATGTASGIFVVDIDGADGERELRRLEVEYGTLPSTVESITPRGRHLYFRMPDTPVRNSAGKVAPGIDIRGTGGYTLCPPSIGPSGKRYCWSVDSAAAFADPPSWLTERIAERTHGNGEATPPAEWRELVTNGVDEGARDCTVAKLCGHLLRHRVDPIVALEILQCWNAVRCRPPLPEAAIERIVGSIAGKEFKRRYGA
jgi:Bifunctional DNA primase/polymerase, N-terminal/Primase C terminal 1 (PriCT-1)